MISPAIRPPRIAPGNEPTPPMTTTTKVSHQDRLAHVGRQRHHRRIDDAGKARRHRADAEHDHEHAVDVDAERIHHGRILDSGAHDHAEPRAVEHEEQRSQRHRDDADDGEAIGRIEHEAERGDARRTAAAAAPVFDRLPKTSAPVSTKHDAEPEGDQKLVLVRAAVEMADDDALHHHADDAAGTASPAITATMNEPVGLVRDIAGVAAEHEHRAMRQVQHAERAVDDGEAGADQRQQRARAPGR